MCSTRVHVYVVLTQPLNDGDDQRPATASDRILGRAKFCIHRAPPAISNKTSANSIHKNFLYQRLHTTIIIIIIIVVVRFFVGRSFCIAVVHMNKISKYFVEELSR